MDINILITSAGRRVELVKAFKTSKDKLNIKGKVSVTELNPYSPSIYFADNHYFVPKITSENFISTLIDICNKDNISLIVPTIDTELQILSENKKFIENNTKAKVLISDISCINICRNKEKTAKFLFENGFNVPITYSKSDIENNNVVYPLYIKPLDGSSSINAFKVNNFEELKFFMNYIKNPIVQECVSGIEYTIDVFLDFDSNVISAVPRQRLAIRGGEILKGKIEKNYNLISEIKKIMNVLKPIGHITVQGIMNENGIMKYLEINPRFGGGAPMSFMVGANSPMWLYQLLQGKKLNYFDNYKDGQIFLRFDDCVMIEE